MGTHEKTYTMTEQSKALFLLQIKLLDFMSEAEASEIAIEIEALGRRSATRSAAVINGAQQIDTIPDEIIQDAVDLRTVASTPSTGAWTWARLDMISPYYYLNFNVDYDREPALDPPVTAQDCADELHYFPRVPEAIPDWMRV